MKKICKGSTGGHVTRPNSRGSADRFQRTNRKKNEKNGRKERVERDQQPGGNGDLSANTQKNILRRPNSTNAQHRNKQNKKTELTK